MAGRKLVYLPQDDHIGVSQKIEDETRREVLREQVTRLKKADEKGGYIVRTCAEESATDEEFLEDMRYLGCLWQETSKKASVSPAPSLLYEDLSLSKRVLRDMVQAETRKILVDSKEVFEELKEFARVYAQSALPLLELYTGEEPLFETQQVEAELQRALDRRVRLKAEATSWSTAPKP